jgi:TusA-related sulfurtransferase
MSPGQVLAVLLDRQGARNVPESAGRDGHHVLSVVEEQDRWRVVIRRG